MYFCCPSKDMTRGSSILQKSTLIDNHLEEMIFFSTFYQPCMIPTIKFLKFGKICFTKSINNICEFNIDVFVRFLYLLHSVIFFLVIDRYIETWRYFVSYKHLKSAFENKFVVQKLFLCKHIKWNARSITYVCKLYHP